MDMGILFSGFLLRIAIGAGLVFALILVVWLGLPRRSATVAHRRSAR